MRGTLALILSLLSAIAGAQTVAIPAGTIIATTGGACPTGFTAYTAGDGRFLVGSGTLGSDTYTVGGTGGEARHTLTTAEMPQHVHPLPLNNSSGAGGQPGIRTAGGANSIQVFSGTTANLALIANSTQGGGGAHENRPPFVGVRYCTLDSDFTGGGMEAEAFTLALCVLCFAIGVIAGQQR